MKRGLAMKMQFLAAVWFGVCAGSSHAGTRSFVLPSVVGKEFVRIMSQGDMRTFVDLLKTLPRPDISKAVVDEKGNTLLHFLAQRGRADMIALAFLLHGLNGGFPDAGVQNDAGGSAQQLAEACGHDEVCSLLRSVQAIPRPSLSGRVFYPMMRILQPHDILWRDGYYRIRRSLTRAAGHGEYGAVVALVNAMRLVEEMGFTDIDGIDISSVSSDNGASRAFALEQAISAHDTEVFDFLAANGAVRGWHLSSAAIADNVYAINYLLAAGIDVDFRYAPYHPHDSTSLQVAALEGNVNAVVALLDAGADINSRSGYYHSESLSALDFALDNGEGGLNVNTYMVNQDGLMIPKVNTRRLRVAKILIERGARVTSSNVRKLTALGVYDGGDRITAGIDRIAADADKLHRAAARDDMAAVRACIDDGSCSTWAFRWVNDDGKTPFEVAVESGHNAVAALLLRPALSNSVDHIAGYPLVER